MVWFNMLHLAGLRLRDRFELADVGSPAQASSAFQVRVVFSLFLVVLNAIALFGPIGRTYFNQGASIEAGQRNAS
jgi:hypothetical protein